MGTNPAARHVSISITFAPGTVDYKFTDDSYTYLGETLNVIFTDITIINYINSDIYYSIERDPGNTITVNSAATQGVTRIGRQGTITEEDVDIKRLRITSGSAGRVDVILYRNPRTNT